MFVGILLRDSKRDFGVEIESSRHREVLRLELARGQKTIGSHLNRALNNPALMAIQPRSQGPLSTSRKYSGYGWSGVC